MKSLSGKLGVILVIGFAVFGYAEVWGADWKVFDEEILMFDRDDPSYTGKAEYKRLYYYDRESIIKSSKDIVKVWSKFVNQRETKSKEEAMEYVNKRYLEELEKERELLKKSKYKNEKEREDAIVMFMIVWNSLNGFKYHQYALKYGMTLYQFNCLERTYRELENGNHDKEGNYLSGYGDQKTLHNIEPESQMEKLYKKVCK